MRSKLIFVIILFMIGCNFVYAENHELLYDIESFSVDSSTIKVTGWADIHNVNNVGGSSTFISLYLTNNKDYGSSSISNQLVKQFSLNYTATDLYGWYCLRPSGGACSSGYTYSNIGFSATLKLSDLYSDSKYNANETYYVVIKVENKTNGITKYEAVNVANSLKTIDNPDITVVGSDYAMMYANNNGRLLGYDGHASKIQGSPYAFYWAESNNYLIKSVSKNCDTSYYGSTCPTLYELYYKKNATYGCIDKSDYGSANVYAGTDCSAYASATWVKIPGTVTLNFKPGVTVTTGTTGTTTTVKTTEKVCTGDTRSGNTSKSEIINKSGFPFSSCDSNNGSFEEKITYYIKGSDLRSDSQKTIVDNQISECEAEMGEACTVFYCDNTVKYIKEYSETIEFNKVYDLSTIKTYPENGFKLEYKLKNTLKYVSSYVSDNTITYDIGTSSGVKYGSTHSLTIDSSKIGNSTSNVSINDDSKPSVSDGKDEKKYSINKAGEWICTSTGSIDSVGGNLTRECSFDIGLPQNDEDGNVVEYMFSDPLIVTDNNRYFIPSYNSGSPYKWGISGVISLINNNIKMEAGNNSDTQCMIKWTGDKNQGLSYYIYKTIDLDDDSTYDLDEIWNRFKGSNRLINAFSYNNYTANLSNSNISLLNNMSDTEYSYDDYSLVNDDGEVKRLINDSIVSENVAHYCKKGEFKFNSCDKAE